MQWLIFKRGKSSNLKYYWSDKGRFTSTHHWAALYSSKPEAAKALKQIPEQRSLKEQRSIKIALAD